MISRRRWGTPPVIPGFPRLDQPRGLAALASFRFPREVWSVWASGLVTAVILAPLLSTMVLSEELRSSSGLATTALLVVNPTILGAAVILYGQYRLRGSNVVAWLSLCLTTYAVQATMLAGLRAGEPSSFFQRPGWVMLVDVPVAAGILAAVLAAPRVRLRVDPLAIGLVFGLVIAAVNLSVNTLGSELHMTSPPVVVAEVVAILLGIGIGIAAFRLDEIPRWAAIRLGLGTLALATNRVSSFQEDSTPGNIVAVVSGVVGAVLVVTVAGAWLRFGLQENRRSLTTLSDHVSEMEADERDTRARLHEITNSIASIAVASSLIHGHDDVPPAKRRQLAKMLESESSRLARVLTNRGYRPPSESEQGTAANEGGEQLVDLDEVISPLVTSQQALRRSVRWEPSGHRAVADPDTVAEVVNILLDNSARHAPDSHTTVEVRRSGDAVEITVSDDGPGVPAEVTSKLFEWGGRGPKSQGQGIGLHLASQLMTSGGNTLRLESSRDGTSFVVGLPAPPEDRS